MFVGSPLVNRQLSLIKIRSRDVAKADHAPTKNIVTIKTG